MRTEVKLSDIEDIKNSTNKDFINGGIIHTEPFIAPQLSEVVKEPYVDKDGEIKYTIVERKYKINKVTNPIIHDEATKLFRFGLYKISQLRKEFSEIEFEEKYLDDLKAFKIEFPEANKTTFVEDEIIRLNEIKEYLQKCLPVYYRNFPEYQKLNSYLNFVKNKIMYENRKLQPNQIDKLNSYYEVSINFNVFNSAVIDFFNMVENANFESLKINKKAKVKFLIYLLSNLFGDSWYKKAAKSLGFKPADCSGANVPKTDIWRKKVERICKN